MSAKAIQIYRNLRDLLQVGQFPGSVAGYVASSQLFLDSMIKEMEAHEQKADDQGSSESIRDEEDTTGVSGS